MVTKLQSQTLQKAKTKKKQSLQRMVTKLQPDATKGQNEAKSANTKKSTVPQPDDNENTVGLKVMTRAGRSNWLKKHPIKEMGADAKLAVRCCSDIERHVTNSTYGCNDGKTYQEAVAICKKYSYRLCTLEEVNKGRTDGAGCGFDYKRIWTSTVAGRSNPAPTKVVKNVSKISSRVEEKKEAPTKAVKKGLIDRIKSGVKRGIQKIMPGRVRSRRGKRSSRRRRRSSKKLIDRIKSGVKRGIQKIMPGRVRSRSSRKLLASATDSKINPTDLKDFKANAGFLNGICDDDVDAKELFRNVFMEKDGSFQFSCLDNKQLCKCISKVSRSRDTITLTDSKFEFSLKGNGEFCSYSLVEKKRRRRLLRRRGGSC